jgi:hypothetical protein
MMNRFAQNVTIAAGLMTLLAVPASVRANQVQARPTSPNLQQGSASAAKPPSVEDYFAGLDYSDEQKTSIDKVKQDMDAKKTIVANDAKLNNDQKGAMIQGYTRLEYQQIFKLLTPAQQKKVRQRMDAAKAAANKGPKKPAGPMPPRQ